MKIPSPSEKFRNEWRHLIEAGAREGQQMVAAFRDGILLLLAAPFVVFGTITTMAIRKFRQR